MDIAKSTAFHDAVHIGSPEERVAAGKALREKIPRNMHGQPHDIKGRPNPIDLLHKSDAGRMKKLLEIRYGRMLQSPFAFYRGAAAVMAADLARMPTRTASAGMRRLSPSQFWWICHARTQPHLRHQRFRRDFARTMGV